MVIDQLDSQNACMIADNQTTDSATFNCSFQVCILVFNSRAEQWHELDPQSVFKKSTAYSVRCLLDIRCFRKGMES